MPTNKSDATIEPCTVHILHTPSKSEPNPPLALDSGVAVSLVSGVDVALASAPLLDAPSPANNEPPLLAGAGVVDGVVDVLPPSENKDFWGVAVDVVIEDACEAALEEAGGKRDLGVD